MVQQVYTLSHTYAMKGISVVQKELEKDGKGAAVAVVDAHGELLAVLRTDGCRLCSSTIEMNKAFTAAGERRESRALRDSLREKAYPLTYYGEFRYVGWGGGVRLVFQGEVIGGVGVSGLPEEVDMVLARLGAGAL